MVVYLAFSQAVVEGLWRHYSIADLAAVLVVDCSLLFIVLLASVTASRTFRFSRQDEIAIVFCGSKKSLASGIPMADILFAGHSVGAIILPLMLFHQIQLVVCALIARKYANYRPIES